MRSELENAEVAMLARKLAERTGETVTEAVLQALRERLARTEAAAPEVIMRELAEIRRRCAELPVRDPRSADEILGYDADGLPR